MCGQCMAGNEEGLPCVSEGAAFMSSVPLKKHRFIRIRRIIQILMDIFTNRGYFSCVLFAGTTLSLDEKRNGNRKSKYNWITRYLWN